MLLNPLFQLFKLALWICVVKTPLAFLQKEMKMLGRNAVEFSHVAFGLVPKILNPIDVILTIGEQLGVVDPEVLEPGHIKDIVAVPAV